MAMNENFKSVINIISDWIIRIVIINLLIIICSLPLITLFPALISGYSVMDSYIQKKEVPLIKTYFLEFKKYAVLGVILSIMFFLAYGINTFNYIYFINAEPLLINTIGIYVTMVLYIVITMMMININIIIVRQKETKLIPLINITFVYSIKFFFRTLILIVIALTSVVLSMYVPMLIFLVSISGVIYLTLMTTNIVNKNE